MWLSVADALGNAAAVSLCRSWERRLKSEKAGTTSSSALSLPPNVARLQSSNTLGCYLLGVSYLLSRQSFSITAFHPLRAP